MWRLSDARPILGFYSLIIAVILHSSQAAGLLFRVDQFTDLSQKCKDNDNKLTYILNEDKPAMYVSIDPKKPKGKSTMKNRRDLRPDDILKRFVTTERDGENVINAMKKFQRLDRSFKDKEFLKNAKIVFKKLLRNKSQSMQYINNTFDCSLQFETEKPLGDKTSGKYDALSLIIVELSHNALIPIELPNFDFANNPTDNQKDANSNKPPRKFFNYIPSPNSRVEVITSGKNGRTYKNVTKRAQYSERIWPGNNPNFLLSGQLSGFDSIDYRTKIDPQVIYQYLFLQSCIRSI